MGNCLGTCFGQTKKKTNYFVGRYKDYNVAIEFENLIEDENTPSSDNPVITDTERQYLLNKKFTDLEKDQRVKNAELDAELRRQEENLKIEEEAMHEAKREAARLARQARVQEQDKKKKKKLTANGSVNKPSWLGDDDDWDVAGGEDDFEMFLDSVKARSQAVRANVASLVSARPATNLQSQHKDSTVTMVTSSSNNNDYDWEYEQGFSQPYQRGANILAKSTSKTTPSMTPTSSQQAPQHQGGTKEHESDLEWDSDFVSADTIESNPVPVSGGKSFGDSENKQRTNEPDVQVVSKQPVKVQVSPQKGKDQPPGRVAANVTKKAANTKNTGKAVSGNVATAKGSGIGVKPAVKLPNSTSVSNSKLPDSMSNQVSSPAEKHVKAQVSPQNGKDVQPGKVAAAVADKAATSKNAGKAVTGNGVTAKGSGIGVKPAVQLPKSTSQSNSKPSDSTSKQVPSPATSKPQVLSNSASVQETAATKTSTNSTRTENPAGAKGVGKAEDQGLSTKVVEDFTESLDEFDIDKFLEELDFDT
ncbi:uncharacterized protein [Amphiura filiformis]|uniref:uncharacterized protein isoform X1 n=1 Tax=Amphiura filiformis TaxID=82378 RepID=UPI003B2184DF